MSFKGEGLNQLEHAAMQLDQSRKHHYVSFSDVAKHSDFILATKHVCGGVRAPGDVTVNVLNKILWSFGLDITKNTSKIFAQHRTYDNSITAGPTWRWEGLMRMDQEWVDYVYKNTGVRLKVTHKQKIGVS
jgi:hypothetical protein